MTCSTRFSLSIYLTFLTLAYSGPLRCPCVREARVRARARSSTTTDDDDDYYYDNDNVRSAVSFEGTKSGLVENNNAYTRRVETAVRATIVQGEWTRTGFIPLAMSSSLTFTAGSLRSALRSAPPNFLDDIRNRRSAFFYVHRYIIYVELYFALSLSSAWDAHAENLFHARSALSPNNETILSRVYVPCDHLLLRLHSTYLMYCSRHNVHLSVRKQHADRFENFFARKKVRATLMIHL